MKTLLEDWRRFQQAAPEKKQKVSLRESKEILNEISRQAADKIYDWMADAGAEDYSFNDLFDGRMRLAFPLRSQDEENLKTIVFSLRQDGWSLQGFPFSVSTVKQKKKRLGTGETYEVEEQVAKLNIYRSLERIIPKGPRAGEKTVKKEETTMSRAINKSKDIPPDLKKWWQNKQTFYTKEGNHKKIEIYFRADLTPSDFASDMTVIMSRHPIDVLRMSDIGSISSCHAEGNSHFKCAVAEAKGHGPIAYLVPTKELKSLLSGTKDAGGQAYLGDYQRPELESLEPEAKKYIEDYINANINYKEDSVLHQLFVNNNKEQIEQMTAQLAPNMRRTDAWRSARDRGETWADDITVAALEDALATKVKGEEWEPNIVVPDDTDLSKLAEFDDKEIFRDRQRSVSGISASTRLRLRKFMNDDGEDNFFFAVPEQRMYGVKTPGFVNAIIKWAFDNQEQLFEKDGERLVLPAFEDLHRFGASYEDNKDGSILNSFFKVGAGAEPQYDAYRNTHSEYDEEDEHANLADQYENQVEEILNFAGNTLSHASVYAEVHYDDPDAPPYVYGSASFSLEFDENLFGSDAGAEFEIPDQSWQAKSRFFDEFESHARDKHNLYLYWEDGEINSYGTTVSFEFRIPWEDYESTPEGLSGFVDHISSEFDNEYESIKSVMRSFLVEEGYMLPFPFDIFKKELEPEDNDDAPEYTHWDYDVEPGEIEFKLKSPDQRFRTSKFKGIQLGTLVNIGSTSGQQNLQGLLPDIRSLQYSEKFNLSLFKKLRTLESAAREHAQRQLTLPGIEPEIVKELNFPNLMKLRIDQRATDAASRKLNIFLNPVITIESDIDDDDLKAVKGFVDFLDKDENMKAFIHAARQVYDEFFQTYQAKLNVQLDVEASIGALKDGLHEVAIDEIVVFGNQFLRPDTTQEADLLRDLARQYIGMIDGVSAYATAYTKTFERIKKVQTEYPKLKLLDLSLNELQSIVVPWEDSGRPSDEILARLGKLSSWADPPPSEWRAFEGRPVTESEKLFMELNDVLTFLRVLEKHLSVYLAAALHDPRAYYNINLMDDVPQSISDQLKKIISVISESNIKKKSRIAVRIKR